MTLYIHIRPLDLRTMARWLFLTLGISCLGIYSGVFLQREFDQAYASRQFDRTLSDEATAAFAVQKGGAPFTADASGGRKTGRPSPLPATSAIIGRISVQKLHLSAMVREGVAPRTLRVAVGHIPSTALPGHTGNVGLAGHRDTFFRGLKDLKTSDEILFATLDGEFRYVVESLRIVDPGNVEVLAASAGNVLTLVTCYPFFYVGNAPKRYIVTARQVAAPLAPPLIME